jgi:hypothetical protein
MHHPPKFNVSVSSPTNAFPPASPATLQQAPSARSYPANSSASFSSSSFSSLFLNNQASPILHHQVLIVLLESERIIIFPNRCLEI